jgi:hypothetical protein
LMSLLLAGCASQAPAELVKRVMDGNRAETVSCSCTTSSASVGCSCVPVEVCTP